MQLSLFQWDLIAVGKGYNSLARLDFDDARSRFSGVLRDLPNHPEAGRGMRDLQYWERVFCNMAGHEADSDLRFMWERINGFCFGNSESYRILRLNLLNHLLTLMEGRPAFYAPPDLCCGYLHLQLGNYAAAETHLRAVLGSLPENGRLHAYLADALWMQGRAEIAGAAYAKALLLAPQEVAVEVMRNRLLAAVIGEYGPVLAPIYGFLEGLLPLVEQETPPVTREARVYELLRQAEQARRLGNHQAMVTARRGLKNLAPEILQDYLDWLGAGTLERLHA